MLIAYDLYGKDNDQVMWKDEEVDSCHICSIRLSDKAINPKFRMKYDLDISYTYDGYLIVSEKFRTICIDNDIKGLYFNQLIGDEKYYWFTCENILEFDIIRRETVVSDICRKCNQSYEVIGATPVCLKHDKKIMGGIYRTDIEFGEGNSKHPVMIIGIDIHKALVNCNLKGIDLGEVLDNYSWETPTPLNL